MGNCLFLRKGKTHTPPIPYYTITVNVSDSALEVLLNTKGILTVNSNRITTSSVSLTVHPDVEISYELTESLSVTRTVVVNGNILGTVSAKGDKVSTQIRVLDNDTVTVVFRM